MTVRQDDVVDRPIVGLVYSYGFYSLPTALLEALEARAKSSTGLTGPCCRKEDLISKMREVHLEVSYTSVELYHDVVDIKI